MDKTGWVLVSIAVGLLLWRGRWRKTNVLLAVAAAAATMTVGTGLLHDISIRLAGGVAAVSSKLSLYFFGVDLPWLAAALALTIVLLDVWRGATATNVTVMLAIVAVWSMGSIPGTAGETVSAVATGIASVVTTFFGAIFA